MQNIARNLFHAQLKSYCCNHAKCQIKFVNLFYRPQNHEIVLLTDVENIPKVQYVLSSLNPDNYGEWVESMRMASGHG